MTRNENTKQFLRPNFNEELTKTSLFMLPSIDLDGHTTGYKLLKHFGLVNCYIGHNQTHIKDDSYLYLVFNPDAEAIKTFHRLYNTYRKYSNFVDDYMIDSNLIVVVFRVKDRWRKTYEQFKLSRYSSMSSEYAQMFKKVNMSGVVKEDPQYLVITKSAKYREELELALDVKISPYAELMDPLDLNKEMFNYERLAASKVQPGEGKCQT